ncbi:MAG: site-2 protease family protein [Candidatus Nanohaloarchaea archaeon]
MVAVNPRLIFLLAFFAAIALYVWRDKKLERHSILFIRRTKRGILTIDRIARKAPKFWRFYGWAGVATGALSIVAAVLAVGFTFFKMVAEKSAESGPSLILPGTASETQLQAGVTFVPADYWVLSIIVLMTVHELSHGIVARTEDIEIKSVGWAIVGILPLGAFVEPEGQAQLPGDEGSEDKNDSKATWDVGDWKSRLKVLCAGSFANYLAAALFFVLATGFSAGVTHAETTGYMGISLGQNGSEIIYRAQEGFPAYESGMRNGTLNSINGTEIDSAKGLLKFMENREPGETVRLDTSEGTFSFRLVEKKVQRLREPLVSYSGFINWFSSLLMTVSFLNVIVGLFNMLPIKPLDGGLVMETLTTEFMGEDRIEEVNRFSIAVWALLLAALLMGIVSSFVL